MSDPKESRGPSEAKKGGFGAFEQKYRARWAAEHPNAGESKPAGGQPDPSTRTDASDGKLDRPGKE
jgi:hypothetical protein